MRTDEFSPLAFTVPFVLFTASLVPRAAGQLQREFDMNNASAWSIVQDADAEATFGFDYSALGIPPAPHGVDTLGLKLAANLVEPAEVAAIAASPQGAVLPGKYKVQVDVWLNYYADFDKVGTTEFAGLFVGFDPAVGRPFNGAGLLADGDGDTARDYRLYAHGTEVSLDTGLYEIFSQNNSDPDLVDQFPGQPTPIEQTDPARFDPPNEDVVSADGTLAFAWHTFTADVDPDRGTARFSIDDFPIGTVATSLDPSLSLTGGVALMVWDAFASVSPVAEFTFAVFDNLQVTSEEEVLPGDLNGDGQLAATDLNMLAEGIRTHNTAFDLNDDGVADVADHEFWVKDLKKTWFGDANLDGEFNSSDFVQVFQIGQYEDAVPLNSGWGEGDWNGDGDFDSSDFVRAFQDGGFERGPRAAAPLPEPAATALALIGSSAFLLTRRGSSHVRLARRKDKR